MAFVDVDLRDGTFLPESIDTQAARGTMFGGYGAFYFRGRMMHASRASYTLNRGEIPEGMEVMHICDNPNCVRPDHLRLGTHAENMLDMAQKGRGGSSPHVRGETNGRAVLTANDVQIIRGELALGETHKSIAKKFRVARTTVTAIRRGQNWSYPEAPKTTASRP